MFRLIRDAYVISVWIKNAVTGIHEKLFRARSVTSTGTVEQILIPDSEMQNRIEHEPGLKYRYMLRTTIEVVFTYSLRGTKYSSSVLLPPLYVHHSGSHISDSVDNDPSPLSYRSFIRDEDITLRTEMKVGQKYPLLVDKKHPEMIMLDIIKPKKLIVADHLYYAAFAVAALVLVLLAFITSYEDPSHKSSQQTTGESTDTYDFKSIQTEFCRRL